jgi:ligand-binding sensor domain-containing protein
MLRHILVVIHALFCICIAEAQSQIPVGTWRLHLSYNNIEHVEPGEEKIFAAANSGVLVYDLQERSLHSYNKLNGLSNTGISALKYDAVRDQLLVGYEDGDLDIIQGNTVTNFGRLRDADVTVSKKINHISIRKNLAYLSTSYGVVTFDLQQIEIKETWRDLGAAGETLSVFQTTFLNDSIFLASANGVLAGNTNDNLLDFNNWTRFRSGNFAGPIRAVVTFQDKVYAAGPLGLFRFGGDNWYQEPVFEMAAIASLTSSPEDLFIISDSQIWSRDASGALSQISAAQITSPAIVKEDKRGHVWIGDKSAGLVSNTDGNFSAYIPDGPSLNITHRLVYENERLVLLSGGLSETGAPLNIPGHVNIFENGSWNTIHLPDSNLTDLVVWKDKTYIASFGSGLVVEDASGNITYWDEANSPLSHATSGSRITALAPSAHGLWVANYGGMEPLHLLSEDGTWQSFDFVFPNAQHPTDLSVDGAGGIWMPLNPGSGGGLIGFDRDRNQAYYKTTVAGEGGLPHENVYSVATDRDGLTWVGTGAGVAYFFSAAEDAIKPIFENRFLLRDEKITALAIDGGNRKWIGTESGAWLFSPTGEELVHRFTAENSPLLSNLIREIAINPRTGEVFFATDRGISSYRSDAIDAGPSFGKVKIFPNPVRPGYSGTVGISGLATDAFVRITDISGKLVWQTQANGGMATWHVRDHQGNRVATGVYLVFATTTDGGESVVGKVAVVE